MWKVLGLQVAGQSPTVKWTVVTEGPGASRMLLGEHAARVAFLTPIYVPSFSSYGDADVVRRSLAVLRSVKDAAPASAKGFLFSAHDLASSVRTGGVLDGQLEELLKGWSLWWLDNGAFEQDNLGLPGWREEDIENIVRRFRPSVAVAFEYVARDAALSSLEDSIRLALRSAQRLKDLVESVVLLVRPHPGSDLAPLLQTLDLAQLLDPNGFDVLGVPESSLGSTLDVRLGAIKALRTQLDKVREPKALHIFGASDPTCLMGYTLAGADIFDGLSWSRYWIDFETASLRDKGLWSPTPGTDGYSGENHDIHLAVHNVASMHDWMNHIRELVMGRRDASADEKSILNRLGALTPGGT